jgi:hypothetical protein
MGEQARRRVVETFSLDHVLHRWEQLYHDLLQKYGGQVST